MMKRHVCICMGLSLTLIGVGAGCGDAAGGEQGGTGGAADGGSADGGAADGGGGAADGGGGLVDGDTCTCEFSPRIDGHIEADTCICIDETNKGDVIDIIACAAATCPPTQVYEEEGIELSDPNVVCLLESLRDRATGRLSHGTDEVWGSGGTFKSHHLMIHQDGTVSRASELSHNDDESGESVDDYTEAEQCTLKPATYFDDCLTALANDDTNAAEDCLFGNMGIDQWFETCSVQTPTCE